MEVKFPLLAVRLNDWITGLDWFPTNKYLPLGSLAMELGCAAVVNCEVESSVRDPSLPTE